MLKVSVFLTATFLVIAAGGYALALVISGDNRLIEWVSDVFNLERFLEMEQTNYIAALIVLNVVALGASGILALVLTVSALKALKSNRNNQGYEYQILQQVQPDEYQGYEYQPYEYENYQGYQNQAPQISYPVHNYREG